MAVNNPPRFLNAGSHDAEQDRRLISLLTRDNEGIKNAGDFAVTEATVPNMTVDVAAGECVILGTESATQGSYMGTANSTTNLAVSAAPGSNSRIDVVVAKVQDSEYSGGSDTFSLAVVEGTVSATPTAPAIPNNSLKLAEILITSSDGSVTNSMITDFRSVLVFSAGSATTADRLTTARDITLTGDATGTTSFDGSANVSITTTTPNSADMSSSDGAGRKLTVSTTAPSSGQTIGDLWVQI